MASHPPSSSDLDRFAAGTHSRVNEILGAHPAADGSGTSFAVWAPNAHAVSVIGDFNGWAPGADLLEPIGSSGIWAGKVGDAGTGSTYKYRIVTSGGRETDKADPVGFLQETPPATASIVWDLDYEWGDRSWMGTRRGVDLASTPLSIYEVHLGSWRRDASGQPSYREVAGPLAEYATRHGFTHVELLPLMEHPFYGSWGYQITGYFAPTARYGSPQDLMYLIDVLHGSGVGVILDWVPSHFAKDEHGLGLFDGTHLYEHADPRKGRHPDWDSLIFNYGRNEVRSFLISNARFWLEQYHADGLRVDAVASMLYLDYSRSDGDWIPNEFGGNENIEAVDFLRRLNDEVSRSQPDVHMIAEESTAWPRVTGPTEHGGLGFSMKWDMGWMHDTLQYMRRDPVHRKHHQDELTFRGVYAFSERFVLPLSHDEVVHGKGSLASKMPGDEWQMLANLRLLYGYMFSQPGKKLLFMGGEFGQWSEWNHEGALDWALAGHSAHRGIQALVRDLNHLYRTEPALHGQDFEPPGFEWIDAGDREGSILSFLRRSRDGDQVLVVCNFTPVPRRDYRIGAPVPGRWVEIVNTDASAYGGSDIGNLGAVHAGTPGMHGRDHALALSLPPLAAVYLKPDPAPAEEGTVGR